jgi:hypothetical protein
LDRHCYRSGHSGHWLCHVFQNWDSRTCKPVFDDDTADRAGPSAYPSTGACAKTLVVPLIISRLAQFISERKVQGGLRRVLLTQAKRLQWLPQRRYEALGCAASV